MLDKRAPLEHPDLEDWIGICAETHCVPMSDTAMCQYVMRPEFAHGSPGTQDGQKVHLLEPDAATPCRQVVQQWSVENMFSFIDRHEVVLWTVGLDSRTLAFPQPPV